MTKHLIYGGPGDIRSTRSLKKAIDDAAEAGRRLNIVFVHGIRAKGPGEAKPFTERLAEHLGVTVPPSSRVALDLGTWPEGATMSGGKSPDGRTEIWKSPEEWKHSQPFVEQTDLTWRDGTVRIHEVNYWPLLFPLKARFLLVPEHDLSGNDTKDLETVEYWLAPGELAHLEGTRPISGGGAKINAELKQQIMNWGLSDAVIALGPMRHYLHETIDQAFEHALSTGDDEDEYVVASLSLGSFVVMDAYAAGRSQVQSVLSRTADLYFFANQFALLELARIKGMPHHPTPTGDVELASDREPVSPMQALQDWGNQPQELVGAIARPKQIIAFSDPSDLLTFRVPELGNVTVVNVYDRCATELLGEFENPVTAHTGHIKNPRVWDLLLGRI